MTTAPLERQAASATAIRGLELIDLQHSIIAPYRANVMGNERLNFKAVRKPKMVTQTICGQPGLRTGSTRRATRNEVFTQTPIWMK